jgi:hypothetical protein
MGRGAKAIWLPMLLTRFAIPSIDFPMPEKTHAGSAACIRLARRSFFELLRGDVAKRRVQPDAIVIALDKLLNASAQILKITVGVSVYLFPLEGAYEALATGIVIDLLPRIRTYGSMISD